MQNISVLERVIALEWGMFSQVSNSGGQAQCQTDRRSFEIMRRSQAAALSHDVLESWLEDLETAQQQGRNLMTEKYAWMMQSTAPEEFAQIESALPQVSSESLQAIEEIVATHVAWKRAMQTLYPLLSGCGRPLCTEQDSSWDTSFETYLRGELKTCSARTITLWLHWVRGQVQAGVNAAELVLLQQAQGFGHKDLPAAERYLRQGGR